MGDFSKLCCIRFLCHHDADIFPVRYAAMQKQSRQQKSDSGGLTQEVQLWYIKKGQYEPESPQSDIRVQQV